VIWPENPRVRRRSCLRAIRRLQGAWREVVLARADDPVPVGVLRRFHRQARSRSSEARSASSARFRAVTSFVAPVQRTTFAAVIARREPGQVEPARSRRHEACVISMSKARRLAGRNARPQPAATFGRSSDGTESVRESRRGREDRAGRKPYSSSMRGEARSRRWRRSSPRSLLRCFHHESVALRGSGLSSSSVRFRLQRCFSDMGEAYR